MATKVEKWAAKDGSLHASEYEAMRHDAQEKGCCFVCPACGGLGRVDGEPIIKSVYDAEATARNGQFASPVFRDKQVGFKQERCDVCSGVGWTQHEKKPIKSEVVTGWE